jgi:hypothetical protein
MIDTALISAITAFTPLPKDIMQWGVAYASPAFTLHERDSVHCFRRMDGLGYCDTTNSNINIRTTGYPRVLDENRHQVIAAYGDSLYRIRDSFLLAGTTFKRGYTDKACVSQNDKWFTCIKNRENYDSLKYLRYNFYPDRSILTTNDTVIRLVNCKPINDSIVTCGKQTYIISANGISTWNRSEVLELSQDLIYLYSKAVLAKDVTKQVYCDRFPIGQYKDSLISRDFGSKITIQYLYSPAKRTYKAPVYIPNNNGIIFAEVVSDSIRFIFTNDASGFTSIKSFPVSYDPRDESKYDKEYRKSLELITKTVLDLTSSDSITLVSVDPSKITNGIQTRLKGSKSKLPKNEFIAYRSVPVLEMISIKDKTKFYNIRQPILINLDVKPKAIAACHSWVGSLFSHKKNSITRINFDDLTGYISITKNGKEHYINGSPQIWREIMDNALGRKSTALGTCQSHNADTQNDNLPK